MPLFTMFWRFLLLDGVLPIEEHLCEDYPIKSGRHNERHDYKIVTGVLNRSEDSSETSEKLQAHRD